MKPAYKPSPGATLVLRRTAVNEIYGHGCWFRCEALYQTHRALLDWCEVKV